MQGPLSGKERTIYIGISTTVEDIIKRNRGIKKPSREVIETTKAGEMSRKLLNYTKKSIKDALPTKKVEIEVVKKGLHISIFPR